MKLSHYLWVIPFFSFLAGYLMLRHLYNVNHLEAPALIGRQLQDVVAQLSAQNLNLRLITQKENPDLPQGTILSQTPATGQKIKPHQAVYIVLSKKQQKIACPLLIGKSASIIEKELEALDMRNKNYHISSNRPSGTCIAHYPAAGMLLDEPKITTYLSSGNSRPVLMPDLKGISVQTATEFLKQHNITIQIIHTTPQPDDHVCTHDCLILDQRPLPGSIETIQGKKTLLVQLQVN